MTRVLLAPVGWPAERAAAEAAARSCALWVRGVPPRYRRLYSAADLPAVYEEPEPEPPGPDPFVMISREMAQKLLDQRHEAGSTATHPQRDATVTEALERALG